MSQENVEVAKHGVDAFNRRDLETLMGLCTLDILGSSSFLDAVADFPGREGLERYLAMVGDAFDEFRWVVEEYRDLGNRVLVLLQLVVRGRGSGIPVEAPEAAVIDFRDGKMCRMRTFLDQGDALRAAGLVE
jgi:ketosteroid isomerase-like protein